jgi:opacity protein-like surface antigen
LIAILSLIPEHLPVMFHQSEGTMRRRILLTIVFALALPFMVSAQVTSDDSVTTSTTTSVRTSSSATSDQGVMGFGPVLGWTKAGDSDAGKLTGGLALRLKLSPALGIEGSIMYRQDKYENGAVTASTWPVQATGLIYLLPMIYGAVGAGWYHTTLDYDQNVFPSGTASETTTNFGWHFGGGLEVPLGRASFTADIRYVFLDYNWQELPGTGGTNSNFYTITAGILFGL